ncbi:hypothetical protein [Lacticaseibacillus camelliae]|uniref:hypothetical protein n=1 Tax=Lacticaseibacillus camelliae TaxID=381742 RepID=UPI000705159C|nr:hypothetical protein [Lacticaseibacillus camelliae]
MNQFEIILPKPGDLVFDVTDPDLYSYSLDSSLGEKLRQTASLQLSEKLTSILESAMTGSDILRHLEDNKVEFVAKFNSYTQSMLDSGQWKIGARKDSNTLYGVIVDSVTGESKGFVNLEKKLVSQLGTLPELAAIQVQLQAVSEQLIALTQAVQQVEQGQYNDRFAGVYSARQLIIEGLASKDPGLRERLLMQAVTIGAQTTSKLMLAIRNDASELADPATKSKEITRIETLLQDSLGYLNMSIQMNLAAYTALGEEQPLLATLSNYRTFIKQSLLEEDPSNHRSTAWRIDNGHRGDSGHVQQLAQTIYTSATKLVEDVVNKEIGGSLYEKVETSPNLHVSGMPQGDAE